MDTNRYRMLLRFLMVSLNTSRCSLQQSFIDEIPLFPPFAKGDVRGIF